MERWMRVLGAVAFAVALAVGARYAVAAEGASEWTGYITDTHCGEKGANKDHSITCVEKCVRGGSKAQIFNEADRKAYNLDGIDKIKDLVGKRVVVKGTLDAKSNTIAVAAAAPADSK